MSELRYLVLFCHEEVKRNKGITCVVCEIMPKDCNQVGPDGPNKDFRDHQPKHVEAFLVQTLPSFSQSSMEICFLVRRENIGINLERNVCICCPNEKFHMHNNRTLISLLLEYVVADISLFIEEAADQQYSQIDRTRTNNIKQKQGSHLIVICLRLTKHVLTKTKFTARCCNTSASTRKLKYNQIVDLRQHSVFIQLNCLH